MFWSLAFIAVREEQHDRAGRLPFRFRRRDELVDDDLGTVGEIAELGFPQVKLRREVHRIAVVESEHARIRRAGYCRRRTGPDSGRR